METKIIDNEKITDLDAIKSRLTVISQELLTKANVDIVHHLIKIMVLVDNAIKKERIAILNSEIEKIKKGEAK